MRQESGFGAKKKLGRRPLGRGRVKRRSGEGQGWQKCSAEAAGGGDKGRGPKAYKPNKPDDGKCPLGHLELVCIRRRPMKGGCGGERAREAKVGHAPGGAKRS